MQSVTPLIWLGADFCLARLGLEVVWVWSVVYAATWSPGGPGKSLWNREFGSRFRESFKSRWPVLNSRAKQKWRKRRNQQVGLEKYANGIKWDGRKRLKNYFLRLTFLQWSIHLKCISQYCLGRIEGFLRLRWQCLNCSPSPPAGSPLQLFKNWNSIQPYSRVAT